MATSTGRSTWPSPVPSSPVARGRGQEAVPEQQEAGGNRRADQRRHREKGVLSDRGRGRRASSRFRRHRRDRPTRRRTRWCRDSSHLRLPPPARAPAVRGRQGRAVRRREWQLPVSNSRRVRGCMSVGRGCGWRLHSIGASGRIYFASHDHTSGSLVKNFMRHRVGIETWNSDGGSQNPERERTMRPGSP